MATAADKLTTALLTPFLLYFAGCKASTYAWKTISPPDKSFRAEMPGVAKETVAKEEAPFGEIEIRQYNLKPGDKQGRVAYTVGYVKCNALAAKVKTDPGLEEEFLDEMSDRMVAKLDGSKPTETEIEQQGIRGRSIEFEHASQRFFCRLRLFFNRDRAFLIALISESKDELDSPSATRFFESFKMFP